MDFKIIAATFGAVFLAELADKTQMVGITMASKSMKPFSVFAGSVAAYMVITGISVFLGASLGKYIQPEFLKYGGGFLFIVLGVLMISGRI